MAGTMAVGDKTGSGEGYVGNQGHDHNNSVIQGDNGSDKTVGEDTGNQNGKGMDEASSGKSGVSKGNGSTLHVRHYFGRDYVDNIEADFMVSDPKRNREEPNVWPHKSEENKKKGSTAMDCGPKNDIAVGFAQQVCLQ